MSRRYVFDDAIASAGRGALRFADTMPLFGVSAQSPFACTYMEITSAPWSPPSSPSAAA
jgi:hypothetical protein